jgi:hypothetical protein
LRNIDAACFICDSPETGPTMGDNMTITRIVAIAAVVCAATGMTTQAEAAKRKAAGPTTLEGCPYWVPVCGIVMGSGPDTYVLSGAQVPSVPLYTPVTVRGRKIGNNNFCGGTQFEVKAVGRSQKSCVWR